jgi:hypothetical protein
MKTEGAMPIGSDIKATTLPALKKSKARTDPIRKLTQQTEKMGQMTQKQAGSGAQRQHLVANALRIAKQKRGGKV